MEETRSPRERRYYLIAGAIALIVASLPYIWGYAVTPPGQVYTGFTPVNIDDTGVYFAWMRQAEEGHFFLRNRFTTEPQKGVLFNLFFWLLGTIARTGLPMIAVYHAARVICGGLLLWALVALLRLTLREARARKIAFTFACFAGGFGWLWAGYVPGRGMRQPIDLWQPEAITFLSLYTSPLFCAALALMTVFLTSVLKAERSRRLEDLWPAAIAGALLGNFHSYDILHLFGVWGVYRVVTDIAHRRVDLGGWLRLILVGLASLPTTAYQYWALRVETVFYERAFETFTWSPSPWWILLGLGFPALLAIVALGWTLRSGYGNGPADEFIDRTAVRLILTWSVVGVAIAYLPFPFQRKLLMGAHLPLCAVAGAMLAYAMRRLRPEWGRIALFTTLSLSLPTNLWFVWRDMDHLVVNVSSTAYRPRMTGDEWAALQWLRANTKRSDVVLVAPDPSVPQRYPFLQALLPHLGVYVPAFAGNVVYNGHWSETARFRNKLMDMVLFFQESTPDPVRRAILDRGGIRYVVYLRSLAGVEWLDLRKAPQRAVDWPANAPPYLRSVYENRELVILEYVPGA